MRTATAMVTGATISDAKDSGRLPFPALQGRSSLWPPTLTRRGAHSPLPLAGAGSLGAAVRGYISSAAFVALAPTSKRVRRDILEGLARDHGHLPIAGMKRQHVNRLLDGKAGLPGAALNLLSALRVLMRYAVDVGLRSDDPTVGARRPKLREGGFYPWTEEDIARFVASPGRHEGAAGAGASAVHGAAPRRRD